MRCPSSYGSYLPTRLYERHPPTPPSTIPPERTRCTEQTSIQQQNRLYFNDEVLLDLSDHIILSLSNYSKNMRSIFEICFSPSLPDCVVQPDYIVCRYCYRVRHGVLYGLNVLDYYYCCTYAYSRRGYFLFSNVSPQMVSDSVYLSLAVILFSLTVQSIITYGVSFSPYTWTTNAVG